MIREEFKRGGWSILVKALYTILALIVCILIYWIFRNKKNTFAYVITTAILGSIIYNVIFPSNISIFDAFSRTEDPLSKTGFVIPDIKLSTKSLDLFSTDGYTLEAITSPDDVDINWYSSNEEIVTIDSNGYVRAMNEGNATITAAIIYDDVKYTDTCNITVKSPNIKLDSSRLLYIGENVTLSATTIPELSITWTSSNLDIAKVNDKGEVDGIAEGTATITAAMTYNDKEYSADCVITIKAPIEEADDTLNDAGNLNEEADDILNDAGNSNEEEGDLEEPEATKVSLKDVAWLEDDNIRKNISATTMRGEYWDDCIGFGSSNINADSNAAIIAACDQKYSRFTAEIAPQEGFDTSEKVTLYIYGGCDDKQTFIKEYEIDFMTETFSVDLDISGSKELYIMKSGNYNQGRIAGQFINGYTGMGVLIHNATLYK